MDDSTLPFKKRKLPLYLIDDDEPLDLLQDCASSMVLSAHDDASACSRPPPFCALEMPREPRGKSQPPFKKLKIILGGVVLQTPKELAIDDSSSSSSTSKNTTSAKNKKMRLEMKKMTRTTSTTTKYNKRKKKNVGAAAQVSGASAANNVAPDQSCSAISPSSTIIATPPFVGTATNSSCNPECIMRFPALLQRLKELGVDEPPVHVMRKRITAADINKGQHRLLLPKAQLDKAALHRVMTPGDAAEASGQGLEVKLMNRTGREYVATLKLLGCNKDYRLKGTGYWKLVEDNGWGKGERLDVWLCRTTKVQQQKLAEEEGGDVGRKNSELRMVLLHHGEGDQAAAAARTDDEGALLWGTTADELAIASTLLEMRLLQLAETSMRAAFSF